MAYDTKFTDTVTGLRDIPDEDPSESGEHEAGGISWLQDKKYVLYVLKQLGKGIDNTQDRLQAIELRMAATRGGVATVWNVVKFIVPAALAYIVAKLT